MSLTSQMSCTSKFKNNYLFRSKIFWSVLLSMPGHFVYTNCFYMCCMCVWFVWADNRRCEGKAECPWPGGAAGFPSDEAPQSRGESGAQQNPQWSHHGNSPACDVHQPQSGMLFVVFFMFYLQNWYKKSDDLALRHSFVLDSTVVWQKAESG